MLYKFTSKSAGDLIMLEPNGRRVLEIIGKDPGPRGIIESAEMPTAVQALRAAIAREEVNAQGAIEDAQAQGHVLPQFPDVSLRQRAAPFLEMLRRSSQAQTDIVWGV